MEGEKTQKIDLVLLSLALLEDVVPAGLVLVEVLEVGQLALEPRDLPLPLTYDLALLLRLLLGVVQL
jgi:hypothetical protein